MTGPSDEEKAREVVGPCSCSKEYRAIRATVNPARRDPSCMWCSVGEEIAAALRAAREDEREKCAKVADRGDCSHPICHCECRDVAQEIAAAIRARKEESRG